MARYSRPKTRPKPKPQVCGLCGRRYADMPRHIRRNHATSTAVIPETPSPSPPDIPAPEAPASPVLGRRRATVSPPSSQLEPVEMDDFTQGSVTFESYLAYLIERGQTRAEAVKRASTLCHILRMTNTANPTEFADSPAAFSRLRRWLNDRRSASTQLIYLGYVRAYLEYRELTQPPQMKCLAVRYRLQKKRSPRLVESQPINADSVKKALNSPRYQSAMSLFQALKADTLKTLTVAQSLVLRDALFVDLILLNAPRPSELSNLTLSAFQNARSHDGVYILSVATHKTSSSWGPAYLTLSEDLYQRMGVYQKYLPVDEMAALRRATEPVSIKGCPMLYNCVSAVPRPAVLLPRLIILFLLQQAESPYFLTQQLRKCSAATVLGALKRIFGLRVKLADFRRYVCTYVHSTMGQESRNIVARRMCHSVHIAERYYVQSATLAQVATASALIRQSFGAP